MRILETALFAVLALTAPLAAQNENFEYWPGMRYDDAIPTFDDVLGHGVGERMASYADIRDYLAALTSASTRRPGGCSLLPSAPLWRSRMAASNRWE